MGGRSHLSKEESVVTTHGKGGAKQRSDQYERVRGAQPRSSSITGANSSRYGSRIVKYVKP